MNAVRSIAVPWLLALFGCAGAGKAALEAPVEALRPPPELVPAELGATSPVHRAGDVYLAGQPSPADLALARAQGVRMVLDLRLPGEAPFDEPSTVLALGMRYENRGFQSVEQLDDELFDAVRALLSEPGRGPVLLHCGSSNRVGPLWIAHRVLDQGVELETAVAEAKRAGLRSAAYEARAREYVDTASGRRSAVDRP